MKTDFQVHVKVQKPIAEVFDGVADPKKLTKYFVGSSSGPLREGTQVTWSFNEHPGAFQVLVKKVIPNELIRLEWDGTGDGYNTQIEISFKTVDPRSTLVEIAETGWREDENGAKCSYRNCGGWMHMLCCLKAYLEHGINLRKGSF